jgi:hypothetical protein
MHTAGRQLRGYGGWPLKLTIMQEEETVVSVATHKNEYEWGRLQHDSHTFGGCSAGAGEW